MNKKIGYLFVYVLEKDKKGAGIFPAPFSVYTFLNPHAARVDSALFIAGYHLAASEIYNKKTRFLCLLFV